MKLTKGFAPAVRAEQTVTLPGEADVSKPDVPTCYDNSVSVSGVKIASDYLTGVTLTAPTKTAYTLGKTLDRRHLYKPRDKRKIAELE